MATTEMNAEILKAAEYTVRLAKQQLGKNLDYSINSLEDVETLIQYVKKRFSQLSKEGKLTDKTVQNASMSIGSYIGETIRQQYGGSWIAKYGDFVLRLINGREIMPIGYVLVRLAKNADYSVQAYFSEINQEINPHASFATENSILEEPKKPNPSNNKNKMLFMVGGLGIVALCLLIGIGYTVFSSIQKSNEANARFAQATNAANEANAKFNAEYNAFIAEAEKLNIMTQTGVKYSDFKTQYYEVKTKYDLIGNWPLSYQYKRQSFDQALRGWNYAAIVWAEKLEVDYTYLSVAQDIDNYLGADVPSDKANELIPALMTKADAYYEAGKR